MHLRRALVALASLAGLTLAVVGAVALPARAGNANQLTLITSGTGQSQAVFSLAVGDDLCASNSAGSVPAVPGATVQFSDPNHATVTFPADTPAGIYTVQMSCTGSDEQSFTGQTGLAFNRVSVEKVVSGEGEPPAGTEFEITVQCTADRSPSALSEGGGGALIDATLTYDTSGGVQQLIGYDTQSCTLTETEDGGAQTVTLDLEDCVDGGGGKGLTEDSSDTFLVGGPVDCTETVTNDFAPADVEPDDDTPPPDVQPAGVVSATPTLTG